MRYLIVILLILSCSHHLYAQDTMIFHNELDGIIVTNKKNKKVKFQKLNTNKGKIIFNVSYGMYLNFPNEIDSSNSVGVFIPGNANNSIYIKSVQFPISIQNSENLKSLRFGIIPLYGNQTDSFIEIIPKNLELKKNKLFVDFEKSVLLEKDVKGFYFFAIDTMPFDIENLGIKVFYTTD